jgi:RNA-directed DNA polymerase
LQENIVESHMRRTQSGRRMSKELDGVQKAARKVNNGGSPRCFHHLSIDLFRESVYVPQRRASPGVDGVTWQEYETGWRIG